jgi:hypothetical protein
MAIIFALSGTMLTLFVTFFKRAGAHSDLWFPFFFVLGPWLLLDVILIRLRWMRGVAIAGGLMLALEALIYFLVFVNPQSSTDALAYVLKPWVQVLVFLPIGLLVGRLIDKRDREQAA